MLNGLTNDLPERCEQEFHVFLIGLIDQYNRIILRPYKKEIGVTYTTVTVYDKMINDGSRKIGSLQFEIIKFRKGDDDKDLSVNGKTPYFRILIKKLS